MIEASQTLDTASNSGPPLTGANMEVMLQGLEEQFISKLSAQSSMDWALIETSMNNTQNRVLELEATCNMLIKVNKMIKPKMTWEKSPDMITFILTYLRRGRVLARLLLSQNV